MIVKQRMFTTVQVYNNQLQKLHCKIDTCLARLMVPVPEFCAHERDAFLPLTVLATLYHGGLGRLNTVPTC